jgi:hypothetical protein
MKINAEALFVANMNTGVEVNVEKTKYVVMSGDQNAGQKHNIKIDHKYFEMEDLKYLGTTVTNRNYIYEDIKSMLNSGNVCYYSV